MRQFCAIALALAMGACISNSFYADSGFNGSTVSLSPPTLLANGVDACQVTVTIREGSTPTRGANVAVQAEASTVIQPAAPTDTHGVATAWVHSTTPGLHTISASVYGDGFVETLQATAKLNVVAVLQQSSIVAGEPIDLQVSLRDPNGRAEPTYAGTLLWRSSDPQASLPASQEFTAADGGYRLLQNGATLRTAGVQSIEGFDSVSGVVLYQLSIEVVPAAATRFALSQVPATSDAGQTVTGMLTAYDFYGNVATGFVGSAHFVSTDPHAALPQDIAFTSGNAGVSGFSATLVTAGPQSITVTAPLTSAVAAGDASITVAAGTAVSLGATLAATVPIQTPVAMQITAYDAYGNISPDFTAEISLDSTDPLAQFPSTLQMNASDAGQITFNVVFASIGQQILYTYSRATGLSVNVTTQVVSAGLDHFNLSGLPSSIVAGRSASVHVVAVDMYGDTVTDYIGVVTTTSSDGNMRATPSPGFFLLADAGEKDIDVTFATAGAQTLTVADITTSAAGTATLTVAAQSDVAALELAGMPANVTAGATNNVSVRAVDVYGNTVAAYSGTVHFSSTDPNASLPPDAAFAPADQGNKLFAAPVMWIHAGLQTLQVADTQTPTISSTPQNVEVQTAAPYQLAFAVPPTDSAACARLAAFTVGAQDAYGNWTALNGNVNLVLAAGSPVGALLQGTLLQPASANIATFADIVLQAANSNYRLQVSTPGLQSALSAPLTIAGSPPSIQFEQVSNANSVVTITATLQSLCPATVVVSYQLNNSGTASPASLLPGSSPHLGLRAPSPTPLTFIWDAARDVPHQTPSSVQLQLQALSAGLSATATDTTLTLQNSLSFAASSSVSLARPASCLATVDLNRDGIVDVGTCLPASGQVAVLLGQVDGSLAAPTYYTVGVAPVDLATGDINRDGWPDLLVADANANSLQVLLGAVGGILSVGTAIPLSGAAAGVALADVNLDGALDAVAATTGNALQWALGNGTGTFTTPAGSVAIGLGVHDLALADVNRDGAVDAIVTNSNDQTVGVLLGNRTGFAAQQTYSMGTRCSRLATGDVLRSDLLEVVAMSPTQVLMLLNEGTGAFFGTPVSLLTGVGFQDVALADINVDGNLDLVLATSGGPEAVSIAMGQGSGNFDSPGAYTSPSTSHLSVADINRDGQPDLLTTPTVGVAVLTNATPAPQVRSPVGGVEQFGQALPAAADADFNEDGQVDLLTLTASNAILLLTGNGNGTFNVTTPLPLQTTPAFAIALADFNSDGHIDAVVPAPLLDVLIILLGDGHGDFVVSESPYAGLAPVGVAVGDINHDGKVDLVATASLSDAVAVMLGDGAGNFAPAQFFATDGYPQSVVVTDLNGDGNLDVVAANLAGNDLSVFLGDGLGGLSAANNGSEICANWLLTSDFNNDHIPDFVTNCFPSNTLSIGLGDGLGGINPFTSIIVRNTIALAALSDIDGDGNVDIVLPDDSSAATLGNLVLYGDGTGHFPRNASQAGRAAVALAVDVNADGFTDVVELGANIVYAPYVATSQVITYLNDTTGHLQGSMWQNRICGGGAAMVLTDINQDSKLDVLDAISPSSGDPYIAIAPGQDSVQVGPSTNVPAYASDTNVAAIAVGDINNDGAPDMLSTDLHGGQVVVWLGTSGGGPLNLQAQVPIPSPGPLTLGDLNRDGLLDLVVGDASAVAVSFNAGAGSFGAFASLVNASAPTAVALGDVDGNGTLDLVAGAGSTVLIKLLDGAGNPVGGTTATSTYTVGGPITSIVLADMDRNGTLDWVAGLTVGVQVGLGVGNGAFIAQGTVATASGGARNAVVSDIDGDGKPDVVLGTRQGGCAVYLRGHGDGSLASPLYFPMSTTYGLWVAAGDLSGDGLPDIVGMDDAWCGPSVLGSH